MTESLSPTEFWAAYPALYEKAARIQQECFPYSSRDKGALFYALEVCGEIGELLNVCKKIIRTKDRGKAETLRKSVFPEEAADCAIAMTMLAQSREIRPKTTGCSLPFQGGDIHPLLIDLANRAAGLYAAAFNDSLAAEDISSALSPLLALSQEMRCDLPGAVNDKLDKIAVRALEKHYD